MNLFDHAALYIFGRTKQALRDGARARLRGWIRKIDRLIGEMWMKVERHGRGVGKSL